MGHNIGGDLVCAPLVNCVRLIHSELVEEFHSKTFGGALVELFCALIAYLLADYYHRTYRIRGTLVDTIKIIRNYWNEPRAEYG